MFEIERMEDIESFDGRIFNAKAVYREIYMFYPPYYHNRYRIAPFTFDIPVERREQLINTVQMTDLLRH